MSASPAQWRHVAERLPATGVTSFVPTYTTAPLAVLARGLDRAASARTEPAAVVRRPDLGRIAPGCVADLVWWDQSYVPRRVWIGGELAQAASS